MTALMLGNMMNVRTLMIFGGGFRCHSGVMAFSPLEQRPQRNRERSEAESGAYCAQYEHVQGFEARLGQRVSGGKERDARKDCREDRQPVSVFGEPRHQSKS